MVSVAAERRQWKEAMRLSAEAENRTASDDFGGMYELALELSVVPGGRGKAISLLERAAEGLPRFPLAHALLALLLEESDPLNAQHHLTQARRYWDSPRTSLDEFMHHSRKTLGELDTESET
jgi:hypothetical protein